jgi:hypothetical protein
MRKQDEPLFDQDGFILMNDEGKKPCTEDRAGMEWLKASHKAFGRSIFAHKLLLCRFHSCEGDSPQRRRGRKGQNGFEFGAG